MTYAYKQTPNIKHIREVPETFLEYGKLFNYISFVNNHTCYYCGKKYKTMRGRINQKKRDLCLDFIDESCINLRDENLVVACVDQDACSKRIIYKSL